MKKKQPGFSSLCTHDSAHYKNHAFRPHTVPLHLTASFEFETIEQGIDIFTGKEKGYVYARYGNPTVAAAAEKLAQLEGYGLKQTPDCLLMGSGMGAISTLFMATLQQGDAVLTHGNIYGGTSDVLNGVFKQFGIEVVLCDIYDLQAVEDCLRREKNIRLIYFETPSNPTLACADIAGIAQLSKKYHKISAIDNTFASPYLQQPFTFGIDFIIHSTTKYLHGHGNMIGGALLGTDLAFMRERVWRVMKNAGTTANPFDAWLLLNGIKTLPLRMDRQCSNALQIATFLEEHPNVTLVNYPGLPSHKNHALAQRQMHQFGAMLSFEIKGGIKSGKKFLNKLKFCTLAPTLGDVDTLVLHPATMSHLNIEREIRQRYGISDGLIRLSVGIEDVNDILDDLANALK